MRVENSVIYNNSNSEALLNKVEFTAREQGGYFVFLHSKKDIIGNNFKRYAQARLEGETILSETTHEKRNIIVIQTDKKPEEFTKTWQSQSNDKLTKFTQPKEEKKKDLVQIRGFVGIFAQISMILSGFFDPDKSTGGHAKKISSAISFFGYGLNTVYGVQKEMDPTRLNFAKEAINKNIELRHQETKELLPKASATKRTAPAGEEPSWMERNSVKFTSAIKLAAKYPLLQLKKQEKESKATDKTLDTPANKAVETPEKQRDEALFTGSVLGITGKVITLLGLPEDPFSLEKDQSVIAKARRQSNLISSMFDWVSTITMGLGVFYEAETDPAKRSNEKKEWWQVFDIKNQKLRQDGQFQWWQGAATVAFVTGLVLKALSPFTNKKIDVDNLMSHTTIAVANAVTNNHADELAKLTTQMLETRELPEIHKLGFANSFTNIANRLESHFDISLSPTKAEALAVENKQDAPSIPTVEKPALTKNADKIEAKASIKELASEKPQTTQAERLAATPNQALSRATI